MLRRLLRRPAPKKAAKSNDDVTALVVGLRNPGADYAGTRHNVGAEVVAMLAERAGESFRKAPRYISAQIVETLVGSDKVILALPTTFMNESGGAVAPLLRYYSLEPEALVVCHDDIDIAFGKLRFQTGRGSGGNRGVESVARAVGGPDFHRLRIGVGRPPGSKDPADYVLEAFSKAERTDVDVVVQVGADVVEAFIGRGEEEARRLAGEQSL